MVHVADESVLASIVAPTRLDGYERYRPEDTVLYQTLAIPWPDFKSRTEEQGGLPQFVVRELKQYLDVGIAMYDEVGPPRASVEVASTDIIRQALTPLWATPRQVPFKDWLKEDSAAGVSVQMLRQGQRLKP